MTKIMVKCLSEVYSAGGKHRRIRFPEGILRIVTVSEAYGSGGSQIAGELAERLGCHYADEALVEKVENNPRQCSPLLESIEDEAAPGFLDKVAGLMNNRSFYKTTLALCVYDLALKADLVLVGAGGHLILDGCPSLISIQIVKKLSDRVRAVAHEQELKVEDAVRLIEAKDKEKSEFVKYYFDKPLFDPTMFHLTVNTGFVTPDEAVELVSEHAGSFFAKEDTASSAVFFMNRLLEKKAQMVVFHLGISHGAKVDFEADQGELTARGVVGGEHEKGQLLEALTKMSDVKKLVDELKVEILSRMIY
jgi:CMP/dCMP kinase